MKANAILLTWLCLALLAINPNPVLSGKERKMKVVPSTPICDHAEYSKRYEKVLKLWQSSVATGTLFRMGMPTYKEYTIAQSEAGSTAVKPVRSTAESEFKKYLEQQAKDILNTPPYSQRQLKQEEAEFMVLGFWYSMLSQ